MIEFVVYVVTWISAMILWGWLPTKNVGYQWAAIYGVFTDHIITLSIKVLEIKGLL